MNSLLCRLRNTALLLDFVRQTLIMVWIEPTTVTWNTQGKSITLTLTFLNHMTKSERAKKGIPV